MILSLLKSPKIIFSLIAIIFILVYILYLKNEISNLNEKIYTLSLENQALSLSKVNLENAIDIQNETIDNLHNEIEKRKNILDETVRDLELKHNNELKQIEKSYSTVEITSSEQAIQWLKEQRYQ